MDGAIAGSSEVPAMLETARRVLALAIGKASPAMAAALRRGLGAKIESMLVVAPAGIDWLSRYRELADPSVRICESSHPQVSEASVVAASAAIKMLSERRPDDLMIVALSGGASAMFALPPDVVPLESKIALTSSLLKSGASIRELNTVRKHLSIVKGGQLLRHMRGARVLSLILSDVPGNDLATIGSGLTAPDPTTFGDAIAVLKRRDLWGRAPEAIRDHLERGSAGEIPETVKAGDPETANVTNIVIGNNRTAVDGAARTAERLGYSVERWRDLRGEADQLGRDFAIELKSIRKARTCFVSGGEPVVTVRGNGKGGRAQQCALSMAIELARDRTRDIAALFAGTDGIDGPTDAAGAFAFADTVERGSRTGADAEKALARNDAYSFLNVAGDLFMTGPTGTNVADIVAAIIDCPE